MRDVKSSRLLAILGIMTFLASGDNYSAAPLLLDISSDLGIGFGQATLSVTAYMLAFGLFTILFGPLGDRYGKTRILRYASFGTAVFSCLGAAAFDLPTLILCRAINGAFAAGIFPVAIALVGERIGKEQRQRSIGRVMGMMFLGTASATAIGGLIAYIGSWRHVYLAYGIAELLVAFIMLKVLTPSPGTIETLHLVRIYREALSQKKLRRSVGIIFLVGFTVLGSFVFAGQLVQERTGFNILFVGLLLTVFGLGTLFGARMAPKLREKMGKRLLLFAGILGLVSLIGLALAPSAVLLGIALFGFGMTFILFQSTLVAFAQECLPAMRGTAMSLASLHMVLGGSIGTMVNRVIMGAWGIEIIYIVCGAVILLVGILSTRLIFSGKM